jgi:hypothetical protein
VYALLANTNLYLPHMLPYDMALCVGVFAVWRLVFQPRSVRLAVTSGLPAGAILMVRDDVAERLPATNLRDLRNLWM